MVGEVDERVPGDRSRPMGRRLHLHASEGLHECMRHVHVSVSGSAEGQGQGRGTEDYEVLDGEGF